MPLWLTSNVEALRKKERTEDIPPEPGKRPSEAVQGEHKERSSVSSLINLGERVVV